VPIELIPASPLKQPTSLLAPDLATLEAARRLIHWQFKIITTNAEAAGRATDPEPLHEIRVAVRRLRAVLRAFAKPLAGTTASEIDRPLQRLNRVLGPARDLDVWLALLTNDKMQQQLPADRRLTALVRYQLENRRLLQPTVRRYLSGSSYNALRLKIGRLVRTELPQLQRTEDGPSLTKLARRTFGKFLRRAIEMADLRHSESPDELHELRQMLRRARYQGEFFAPLFGAPFPALTKRIHAVERTLAAIHDADVALARLGREGPPPPPLLVQELQRRRSGELSRLAPRWNRLEKLVSERVVRRQLKL
jgi:CHAD domain-containing protein